MGVERGTQGHRRFGYARFLTETGTHVRDKKLRLQKASHVPGCARYDSYAEHSVNPSEPISLGAAAETGGLGWKVVVRRS